MLSALDGYAKQDNRRFEGSYGRLYSGVIRSSRLRRAAFSLWGSADPLHRLDAFVADAVAAARVASDTPVIVDLPSGAGTLLPLLSRHEFSGRVVEVDLAVSMLREAVTLERKHRRGFQTVFVQADALDLPLADAVADVVISINGLHVVPDARRFLAEICRILKPDGRLWLITPVTAHGLRSRMILAAAAALKITPGSPPTLTELRALVADVGLREMRSYGGTSITGFACVRAKS